ncbi:MAG: DUF1566 domain-containing protein [Woeseiaceae bacterium]
MKKLFTLCICALLSPVVLAQTCSERITSHSSDTRFVVNGEEVSDSQTGLIWQKCSLGMSGSNCLSGSLQSMTWEQALQAAEIERQQTGKAWRLPNIKELLSIVEEQCENPAINVSVFPNTNTLYWSASPNASRSDDAWFINFGNGGIHGYNPNSYNISVHLVRSEM